MTGVNIDWSDKGEVMDLHGYIVAHLDEKNLQYDDYSIKNESVYVLDKNGEVIEIITLDEVLK